MFELSHQRASHVCRVTANQCVRGSVREENQLQELSMVHPRCSGVKTNRSEWGWGTLDLCPDYTLVLLGRLNSKTDPLGLCQNIQCSAVYSWTSLSIAVQYSDLLSIHWHALLFTCGCFSFEVFPQPPPLFASPLHFPLQTMTFVSFNTDTSRTNPAASSGTLRS